MANSTAPTATEASVPQIRLVDVKVVDDAANVAAVVEVDGRRLCVRCPFLRAYAAGTFLRELERQHGVAAIHPCQLAPTRRERGIAWRRELRAALGRGRR